MARTNNQTGSQTVKITRLRCCGTWDLLFCCPWVLSIFSLGVPGKFSFWVPVDVALGILGVVASLFLGVFSFGLACVFPVKFSFGILVDPCSL